MTKTKLKKAKPGPKSPANKKKVNEQLRALYREDGITVTHAAEIAECSVDYTSKKFIEFGDEIAKNQPEDQDWFSKNDRVRYRALEGLSLKIHNSDQMIENILNRIKEMKEIQDSILPQTTDDVKEWLIEIDPDKFDHKGLLLLYAKIGNDLNLHKNYGYLIETIYKELREEKELHARLQAQYDTIEITPPPLEVLNSMIAKRIEIANASTQRKELK